MAFEGTIPAGIRENILPLFSVLLNSQKVNGNLGSKADVYKVSAENDVAAPQMIHLVLLLRSFFTRWSKVV